jgi:hypothetical protein
MPAILAPAEGQSIGDLGETMNELKEVTGDHGDSIRCAVARGE